MVSTAQGKDAWTAEHFIGGHPVLDLANTVYSRADPVEDNDLLTSAGDVLTWCRTVGLFDRTPRLTGAAARELVDDVRDIREHVWAVFDSVAEGQAAPAEHLCRLLERAGAAAQAGVVRDLTPDLDGIAVKWTAPHSIPSVLALMAVQAYFTLPADRIRACDRCGWLFLDSSRGGRRRWCSMSTCGNREKATRHRSGVR